MGERLQLLFIFIHFVKIGNLLMVFPLINFQNKILSLPDTTYYLLTLKYEVNEMSNAMKVILRKSEIQAVLKENHASFILHH